jgi:hypothetical protein
MAAANIPSNSEVDYKMERLRLEIKTEILLELEENLLCNWCELVPRPGQIYQCLVNPNHIKCSKCFETNNVSSTCGRYNNANCCGLLGTGTAVVENLLKLLPRTCKNKKNGCKQTLMINDLDSHEGECIYREIFCPTGSCSATGKTIVFIDFPNHVANHGSFKKTITKNSFKFKFYSTKNVNVKFFNLFGGKMLFLKTVMYQRNLYLWVCLYGNPAETEYYYYKVKITGKGRQKMSFQEQVQTLDDDDCLGIVQNKAAMTITEDDFKRLAIDGKLDCEVTIKSDKEEIKDENVESGISDNDED